MPGNPAPDLVADGASLDELAAAAQACTACELYRRATRAVFGTGPPDARVILVGEQPGDREDESGEPFVGPAGRILDRALAEAGIDRDAVYVTNTVKHFKWRQGTPGWRRLHAKPDRSEVSACLPWLEAEVYRLDPRLVVGLGATACQAMLGSSIRVTKDRGEIREWNGRDVLVTVHPSSLLRDRERRVEQMQAFVGDLTGIAPYLR